MSVTMTKRSALSDTRAIANTANPSSAYSVRMSPYHTKSPCTSPIASSTPQRRAPKAQQFPPARNTRSTWVAMPKPNSSENSEMHLNVHSVSTTLHAMRSASVVATPSISSVGSIATASGQKKKRTLTRRIPSSARPRAMSTPRMRCDGATGLSVDAGVIMGAA